MALRLIALMLRHRLIAGLLILASISVSLYAARRLEVRFQYRDFYDYPDNPRLPLMQRYTREFGDPGGAVVVLVESPDVFAPEVLRYVDAMTRQLESLEQFSQIRSLTNIRLIRADGENVESGQLLQPLPTTAEEIQRARQAALGSTLLVRRLVAPNGTATAVLAEMRTPAALASIAEQEAAVRAVERVVRETAVPTGTRARVTGGPLVEVEITKALIEDQVVLTPTVLLILVVALTVTFRSLHGIILPLAAVLVSMIWTAGVFSCFRHPIDLVGSTIPTTLLVYGVVDPTFVYTRFVDKLSQFRTAEQAVLESMSELLVPCLLSSVVTALGFGAFVTATLPTVMYFGIAVALGVLFAFLTTVTVLPLLLVWFAPTQQLWEKPWSARLVDALMARIWRHTKAHGKLTFAFSVLLLIAGAVAVIRTPINSEYVGILPRGRAQDSVRALEREMSGVLRLVVYLEGEPDSMKRPEVLAAIEALDRLAKQQPIVTTVVSLADLVADTNQAFNGGDPKEHHIPDSAPLISQYLSLVDPSDLSDFVTSDYSRAPIQVLASDRGSVALWELRDILQRECAARFPQLGIRATITGHGVVTLYDLDVAVRQVVYGFWAAFCAITGLGLILFRSIRVALISVIPNLLPVGACFLVMRGLGLNLRLDTSLVLCVSIGALFNTTIHIAARVMQQVQAGAEDRDVVVGRALAAVGPPSLYTAVILSLGFSAMGLSHFPGLQVMGLLCMVTMLTAFLSDALLTTSLFWHFFDWRDDSPDSAPIALGMGVRGEEAIK